MKTTRANYRRYTLPALAVAVALVSMTALAKKEETKESAMDQAAMAKAMKLGSPGEGHKTLEPMVGQFDYTAKFWMKPGAKPETMKGTSVNTWALGGRFVQQQVKGQWAGQPFEGLGFTGYDNVKKKYVSVWMDNMSTGIMDGEGTLNDAKKTVQQSGKFSCPMTETQRSYRSEWTVINPNRHRYTSYHEDEKGKEMKTMEITYTRQK